jgi:hypothetical protein
VNGIEREVARALDRLHELRWCVAHVPEMRRGRTLARSGM